MKQNISFSDIRKYSLNAVKRQQVTIFDFYFYRPIAYLFLPFLHNYLRLSPNGISILSIAFSSSGFLLLGLNTDIPLALLGVACLMFFMVLDCADGSLARITARKYGHSNPLGEFFDAFAGYIFIAGFGFALGGHGYLNTNNPLWLLLGGLCSVSGLFPRTAFLKLNLTKQPFSETQDEETELRSGPALLIYKNLDWGGGLLFALLLAVYFGRVEWIIFLTLFLNGGMTAWLLRHVYREQRAISSGNEVQVSKEVE